MVKIGVEVMENKSKFIRFLNKYYKQLIVATFSIIVFSYLFNTLINLFSMSINAFFVEGTLLKPKNINYTTALITDFSKTLAFGSTLSIIFFLVVFLATAFIVYKFHSNFGSINKQQKGDSRFTTIKEVQKQYRSVPLKDENFDGKGGIPIMQYESRVYIDDSAVNNLIIGTTRSGKGEIFVFPTIDIYSRAEIKTSMILTDPKGELVAASKETLEKRGYDVFVLNLLNPEESISYNLLELVKIEFYRGNYSMAQQYAYSLAFSLYNDPEAKDPFWNNSSTDLCTALILGLCEHCRYEPEKITMYTVAVMMSELGSDIKTDEYGRDISRLDEFFNRFEPTHPARLQYQTVKFANGQTRASILANTNAKLGIFTLPDIARLTSQNTLDLTRIGFGKVLKGTATVLKRVSVKFANGEIAVAKTGTLGTFEIYHNNDVKVNDEITLEIDNKKMLLKVTGVDKDGTVNYTIISKETDEINLKVFEHYTKPIALFCVVPDYDPKFNVIVTMFIDQLYKTLSRISSNVREGKCHREVVFLLDEFGNFPAINSFASMLTVCLGRNIRFNLIIQSYAQIEKLYEKDWKTIDGNTNNTIYFLTDDIDTAEKISKKCGEKTIVTKSRSGTTFSFNKSKTESIDTTRLIDTRNVTSLKLGESIVIRTIKREDNERQKIKQFPIYNQGKTASKFRYEYLADSFVTNRSLNDLDLNATHNLIDVPLLRADFDRETPFLNDRHSNEEIQSFNDLVNKNTPTESQEKPKHIPLKKTGMAATTKKPAKSKQTKLDESVEEQNQLLADANKATSVVANGLNKSIFAMGIKTSFEDIFGTDFEKLTLDEVSNKLSQNEEKYDAKSYKKAKQYLLVQKKKRSNK